MIAKNFMYCQPNSLTEAIEAWQHAENLKMNTVYYGGGSEIITMTRAGSITPGALIDIKKIPECNVLKTDNTHLIIGAAVTLNRVNESGLFPLLGHAAGRIADHTNQCRITIGGNLCGTIIYKEAVLPLLLADADILIQGISGIRTAKVREIFDKKMHLKQGEFIFQIHVNKLWLNAPYMHVKKTGGEKIDYPLVTACVLKDNTSLRAAFSGICPYPFRSLVIERILDDSTLDTEQKIIRALEALPSTPLSDVEGTGSYRKFIMKHILENILERQKNDLVFQ